METADGQSQENQPPVNNDIQPHLAASGLGLSASEAVANGRAQVQAAVHQSLQRQLRAALQRGDSRAVARLAGQMRATAASAGEAARLGTLASMASRGLSFTGVALAVGDAAAGKAGYSKPVLYAVVIVVTVASPPVGVGYGAFLMTLDLSGELDPISLSLDRAAGF